MKRVALVIGHSEVAQGAVNEEIHLSEWQYNFPMVRRLWTRLTQINEVEPLIIERDLPNDYDGLPLLINSLLPDFILSFHCNAVENKLISGSEVLFYDGSIHGATLAEAIEACHRILGVRTRGIRARRRGDRGGYLLYHTKAPCVIVEPFFISNTNDLKQGLKYQDRLIECYARAINDFAQRT